MSDRDELIAKARELSAAASPGPWGIAGGYIKGADTYPVCEPWPPIDRNGRFIAESRTLLPALADLAESEGRRADLNAKHCAEMTAARNRMDEARALACSERDAALAELAAMKGLQP
jgi:hypothetical protein